MASSGRSFKYDIRPLPPGTEQARMPLRSGDSNQIILEDIKVKHWNFEVSSEGNYKMIKIGDPDKVVDGGQQYQISYHIVSAINLFKDHSEFYFNVIGQEWATLIESATFSIHLPSPLPDTTNYFFATGHAGSNEKNAIVRWQDRSTLSGSISQPLQLKLGSHCRHHNAGKSTNGS
ncbi:MAG: DUF2207 domain-containing protein [Ginsengibacter sp.]